MQQNIKIILVFLKTTSIFIFKGFKKNMTVLKFSHIFSSIINNLLFILQNHTLSWSKQFFYPF